MNGSTAANANPRSTRAESLDLSSPCREEEEKKKERGIEMKEAPSPGERCGRCLRVGRKKEKGAANDSGTSTWAGPLPRKQRASCIRTRNKRYIAAAAPAGGGAIRLHSFMGSFRAAQYKKLPFFFHFAFFNSEKLFESDFFNLNKFRISIKFEI